MKIINSLFAGNIRANHITPKTFTGHKSHSTNPLSELQGLEALATLNMSALGNQKSDGGIYAESEEEKLQRKIQQLRSEYIDVTDDEEIKNYAKKAVEKVDSLESAEIAELIFSDKKLFGNKAIMNQAKWLISSAQTPEHAGIIKQILSNKKLAYNEKFMQNASDINFCVHSPDEAEFVKLLLDEKLSDNNHLIEGIPNILYLTRGTSIDDYRRFIGIAGCINGRHIDSYDASLVIKDLKNYPEIDVEELANYIQSINLEQIIQFAPDVEKYSFSQFIRFCCEHLKKSSKTVLTKEDLTYCNDMTSYLQNNYLDAFDLTNLLTAYPCTPREVGELPKGWLDNVAAEKRTQTTREIYHVISNFQQDKECDDLAKTMSKILGKEVTITSPAFNAGQYGSVYRIHMDGTPDTCLKIFDRDIPKNERIKVHGAPAEVQAALFANKHSNDFVKMHFGKISPIGHSDGFLVTQFLEEGITPEETDVVDTEQYRISCNDIHSYINDKNIINSKIIDFGDLAVKKIS